MNQFPYGTVLKIEREFSKEDIEQRLLKIKDLGMNYVVIWPSIFRWESKQEKDYPYATGKKILEFAQKIELKVVMELTGQLTALEYMPDYLLRDEYYAKSEDQHNKNKEFYFGTLNYNHPEVRNHIKEYFIQTVSAYKTFPALVGYDVWNETMFSSYDVHSTDLFQQWLKGQYGDIEKLNDAWDRVYTEWSQIQFTQWTWASIMPVVDEYRFRKANVNALLKTFSEWIKTVDNQHPIIADNIHSMVTEDWSFHRPHDDWGNSRQVDQYGISFYPKVNSPGKEPYQRSQIFNAIASATPQKTFWVSELQSHNQAMFTPISVIYPYELRFFNYEALSRGAKGIMYWMWEPFIKGIQTSGRGLVNQKGELTQRAIEVESIIRLLRQHEGLFLRFLPLKAKIAILYDQDNHNFVKALSRNYQDLVPYSHYTDAIAGLYKGLWELNIPVEFITTEDIGVSDYDIIFCTSQIVISSHVLKVIESYVSQGGTFIADGRLGMINEMGILHRDIPGGELNKDLHIALHEIDYLEEDCFHPIDYFDGEQTIQLPGYHEKQYITYEHDHCKVLATFKDQTPAMIESSIKKGRFISIGTYLWLGQHKNPNKGTLDFLASLSKRYSSIPFCVENPKVKCNALEGKEGILLFVFNYSEVAQSSSIRIQINRHILDVYQLETGKSVDFIQNHGQYVISVQLEAQHSMIVNLSEEERTIC